MPAHGPRFPSRSIRVVRAAAIEVADAPPAADVEPAPAVEAIASTPEARAQTSELDALRAVVMSLHAHVEDGRTRRRQSASEIARLAVEIGVAVAERLLCSEIAADRQRLDRIMRIALGRFPAARAVTVRAHPDDVALLTKQDSIGNDAVRFCADAALSRGHVILESGDFFAEWDTLGCLAEVRKALLEESIVTWEPRTK